MDIVTLFENYFWEVAQASVVLLVPIIAIVLLFKIIGDVLFKEK